MNEKREIDSLNIEKKEEKVLELKEYRSPELKALGSMRKVTLGGASGFDDSGGDIATEQP